MKNNKVAIVPLGEGSREVSQVLANETSRRILDLISDESMSAMHIAYKLDIAINTAQYNLEKMESVGLIEVESVEKSRKGRNMKIYTPTNKIIAIIPKNVEASGVIEALRSIIPMMLIAALFAFGVDYFAYSPAYQATPISMTSVENFAAPEAAMMNVAMEYEESAAKSLMAGAAELPDDAVAPEPEPLVEESISDHPGFWMFIGSLVIITMVGIGMIFKGVFS